MSVHLYKIIQAPHISEKASMAAESNYVYLELQLMQLSLRSKKQLKSFLP